MNDRERAIIRQAIQLLTAACADEPLIQPEDLQIVRSFRVHPLLGQDDGHGFSFAGGPIAATGRGTLYVGNYAAHVCELTIPAGDVATVLVQRFADPFDGQRGEMSLGGLLALTDGRVHGSGSLYYDANNAVTASQFLSPPFSGWFPILNVPGQGYVGGHLAAVPPEWQERLGGSALASGWGLPIISRESAGPNAVAFDPMSLTPTGTILLNYPPEHQTLGTYDGTGVPHPIFNMGSTAGGMVIVGRSLLFFGRTGLGVPRYGGAEVGDPTNSNQGGHAYPYSYYVWAYDLNDLAAVKAGSKAPWEIVPYAHWPLELPTSDPTFKGLAVTIDPVTHAIYLLQQWADYPGTWNGPVFHELRVA